MTWMSTDEDRDAAAGEWSVGDRVTSGPRGAESIAFPPRSECRHLPSRVAAFSVSGCVGSANRHSAGVGSNAPEADPARAPGSTVRSTTTQRSAPRHCTPSRGAKRMIGARRRHARPEDLTVGAGPNYACGL